MKKLLLVSMIALMGCGSNDLDQKKVENWIINNTTEKEFSTSFDNGYGARHSASMENINVTDIGLLEIDDETTRAISAKVNYLEIYKRGWTDKEQKTQNCVFIFKKSTNKNWYLSNIQGNSNQPFGGWMNRIKQKNKKKPL